MRPLAWDDVRVFLAVAREGTVRSAAAAMGTSHSTVLRRVGALEESLDVRLFHRRRDGYLLTAAGERARDAALPIEERVRDIRREVQGGDARLSGNVRVSLPKALLPVLLRALSRFEADYPEIELELLTAKRFVDLHRGDADVAVRIAGVPDERLVGRRVAEACVGVYGSRRYARRVGERDLGQLDWLVVEQDTESALGRWIHERIEPARIRVRLGGLSDLRDAVDAHLGVTLVPCALGDKRRTWHRFHRLAELSAPVWVLSHSDLRTTARVRAVRDFIGDTLSGAASLIAGV